MFNRNFDVQHQVADLYPSARRQVLFSLVGSINATLVQAADMIVQRVADEGFDLKELTVKDIEQFYNGPETAPEAPGSVLHELRTLSALAETMRNDLRYLTPSDDEGDPEVERVGSIYATLNLMTGKQRARPVAAGAVEALKALDIELTPEQIELAKRNQQSMDQARADARACRRGGIEWVLEHVFAVREVGSDGDYWSQLPLARKEMLTAKLFSSLNSAMNQAQQNVLFGRAGDNVLGLADITLIRDIITRLNAEAYPPSTPTEKPKKMRRVAKDKLAEEIALH